MINGPEILALLKLPVAVVGSIGALVVTATIFGFGIITPGERLDVFVEEHGIEHSIISDTLAELDDHLHDQQILIEAMVRGECIENPVEDLQRQGLITTCERLGIER